VNLISGDEEALLIYSRASVKAVVMGNEVSLIMDIGGGSTEFILANEKKVFWKHSYQDRRIHVAGEIYSLPIRLRKSELKFQWSIILKHVLEPLFSACL
jgi:hypothetical protein